MREVLGGADDFRLDRIAKRKRGDHAGRVARVDAGLLDVFHDRADDRGFAIADAIDIDFGRVVEEAVDKHRALGRCGDCLAHVAGEFVVRINDHHCAAAEHEGGADEHRIADAVGDGESLGLVGGGTGVGLLELELVEQGGEKFAVLGEFDRLRRSADDWHAVAFEIGGEVQRRLAAKLHDHAEGFFLVANVERVFERQRFEEQLVGSIVVGGNRLGVRVDHDRLVAELLHREGSVNAAVIELDALANAVGSTAEDDDLFLLGFARFVFVAVG